MPHGDDAGLGRLGGRRELIAGAMAGGIFAPSAANAFQNAVYQAELRAENGPRV